jgi:uncharacterized membrane protein YpjA
MADRKLVSGKMLVNAEEIKAYLRIGDLLFAHFIKLKMPAVQINGVWKAHTDNLDEWWRASTAQQTTLEVPE